MLLRQFSLFYFFNETLQIILEMRSKFLFLLQVDHLGLIIIFWPSHVFELFLLTICKELCKFSDFGL